MWFGRDQDSAYDLEAKAHGLLDAGRTDEARAIAEQLLSMGWSGGFEVKALAQQQAGELPGAIATLEEAVSKVPNLWHLWQLLGNLRSDAGDLDGALEAMNQAIGCEAVSEPALRFNRAIVQHRRGEPGKALDDLEMIMALPRPPEFAEDVLSLAARCLSELGRAEDGLTLVESALEACAEDDPRRPRLEGERAVALDRLGRDPSESFAAASEAGVATQDLLALRRRLHPASCSAPKRFRVVTQSPMDHPEIKGCFRIFDVVADDEAQALALAADTLPVGARDGAAIEESAVIEESTELEPGVHAASGLIYFGDE